MHAQQHAAPTSSHPVFPPHNPPFPRWEPPRWVRWRSIAEEVDPSRVDAPALRRALGAEDTGANACLYLLLRAVDRFHALHSRFPGCYQGCARCGWVYLWGAGGGE